MSWCFIVHGDRWRVWLGVVLHGSCTEFVAVVALVCQIMMTYGIRGPDVGRESQRGRAPARGPRVAATWGVVAVGGRTVRQGAAESCEQLLNPVSFSAMFDRLVADFQE